MNVINLEESEDDLRKAKRSIFNEEFNLLEYLNAKCKTVQYVGGQYSHKATCPFLHHKGGNESTPSFFFSAEKKKFNCFGCGESGDALYLYSALENIKIGKILDTLHPDKEKITTALDYAKRKFIDNKKVFFNKSLHFYKKISKHHPLAKLYYKKIDDFYDSIDENTSSDDILGFFSNLYIEFQRDERIKK